MGANEKYAATFHPDYQCELCGIDRGSYAGMMACEEECAEEARLARRGFINAGPARTMRGHFEDD